MACAQEDDLLQLFEALDIQLLNLNPNVIKAWFDTDDNNMKNLLNWMCVSLSKKNYISPLELEEYSKLPNSYSDDNLIKEKALIEQNHPGIFDSQYNALEIEFLEEELNLLRLEEKELDQQILLNRSLEEKLNKCILNKNKTEVEVSVQLKSTQNKCHKACEKLDALNKEIYEKWIKCTKILNTFEYISGGGVGYPGFTSPIKIKPPSVFICNQKIYMCKSSFYKTRSLVRQALDPSCGFIPTFGKPKSLRPIPFHEFIVNMRHRIVCSRNRNLATTVEIEKLKAILFYLENISIEKLLFSSDNDDQNVSILMKKETRNRLREMLEDSVNTYADHHINITKFKYIEQQLKMKQENLHHLTELEKLIKRLIPHYSVLAIMVDINKKDLGAYQSFFKQVNAYIGRDMEISVIRTEEMKKIIQQYQNTASDDNLRLTKMIIKSLSSDEENFSIKRAYELISNFKTEMDRFETKLFSPDFSEIKAKEKELHHSINILQSFLISGPTDRIIVVPSELLIVMRQVDDLLKNELKSVKSAMEIMSVTIKKPNKWENYRRQLWMYFYSDPDGLNFILHQIQKEFEGSKTNETE